MRGHGIGRDAFYGQRHFPLAGFAHHRRVPLPIQRNIARHSDLGQGRAPCCIISQQTSIDGLPGAPPDTLPAIINFQLTLQRGCGNLLHLRVDAGQHRHPTREKLVFAKAVGQLAADFVGEIIARRQGRFETVEITILNRAQRLRHLAFIGGLADIAVFHHFFQHEIAPRQQPIFAAHRVIIGWRLGQRGQKCRFVRGQLRQRFVEIGLRRCRHPIRILAQKNFVQIQL